MDASEEGLPIIRLSFPLVVAFINWVKDHKKTAAVKRVHTCYSEVFVNVMRDMGQRTRRAKNIGTIERTVEKFKRILVETFDEHCVCSLYGLRRHLLEHIAEDIRRFGTLSVLNSSAYERINVHSY